MFPVDLPAIVPRSLLWSWLGVWTLLGLCAMFADKLAARIGFDRISEAGLQYVALAGGAAGIILGGLFAHHKTSKPDFWPPVAASALLWLGFLVLYFFPGAVPS